MSAGYTLPETGACPWACLDAYYQACQPNKVPSSLRALAVVQANELELATDLSKSLHLNRNMS